MVRGLVLHAIDHRLDLHSGKSKNYKIGICCLSAKHIALRSKTKYWLVWTGDNMSEWGNMSTHGLLFQ